MPPRLFVLSLAALVAIGPVPACAGGGVNVTPSPAASRAPARPSGGRSFAPLAGSLKGAEDGGGTTARFDGPTGLDLDPTGRLLVADTGGHRVRVVAPDGQVSTLAGGKPGWRDGSAAEAGFTGPGGVAIRRDGGVVVADSANHRIRLIARDGTVSTLAGDGTAGDQDGPSSSARFRSPLSVAMTALDEVLVADTGNHRLRLINGEGRVTTVCGGEAGYVDGAVGVARLNGPADVALDAYGRAFVADLGNHAIRRIDLAKQTVQTLAGAGEAGDSDGAAGEARFRTPSGVAVQGDLVYVADAGNRAIRRISPDGRVTTLGWLEAPAVPADVASAPDGTLYVTDAGSHRVWLAR